MFELRSELRYSSCLNREGDGARLLEAQELHEVSKWDSLSTGDKIADWASRHEYSLIIGGWALSLVAAGVIINRDK